MEREEAITILKDISWQMGSVKRLENIKAIDMAIEALSDTTKKDGMDMEQAIEWCKDCQHNEVCRYYPYDGCEFKDSSERPHGEWIPHATSVGCKKYIEYSRCSECGEMALVRMNFCPNCGADMTQHGVTADEWYRDTFKGEGE